MHPFYFSSSSESQAQLFGVYHEPKQFGPLNLAVLLVYPLGQEYMRVHRCYVQLAEQLSRSGYHVLRFDYFATGDSAGQDGEGSVAQWLCDIDAAAEELLAIAGAEELSVVATRAGACFAAQARYSGRTLRDFVVWEPIIDGAEYLESLEQMQSQLLIDLNRFPYSRTTDHHSDDDLVGFRFNAQLRKDIQALNILKQPAPARNYHAILSSTDPQHSQKLAIMQEHNFQVIDVEQSYAWYSRDAIESIVPPAALSSEVIRLIGQ